MKTAKTALILLYVSIFSFLGVPESLGNPFQDLTDGDRKGFIVGSGIGYGTTNYILSYAEGRRVYEFETEALDALGGFSTQMQWKIGYAVLDDLAFYFSSPLSKFEPVFGVQKFSRNQIGLYFTGYFGYGSRDVAVELLRTETFRERMRLNRWDIGGGFGYELREHFLLDLTIGYRVLVLPRAVDYYVREYADDVYLDKVSAFVSFNYLFY